MSSVFFLIGPIVVASSFSIIQLIIGRFIIGLGVGLAAMTIPLYLSEISPSNYRGQIITINTLFITLGQWIANIICYSLKDST